MPSVQDRATEWGTPEYSLWMREICLPTAVFGVEKMSLWTFWCSSVKAEEEAGKNNVRNHGMVHTGELNEGNGVNSADLGRDGSIFTVTVLATS